MTIPLPALAFVARHFLFVVIAAVIGCILWTVAYLVLLAIAVVADLGLGGPLAFPGGIAAVVIACVLFGWGIFAPASAIGAVVCARLGWPRFAAIPVVFVAAFLISYLFHWVGTVWIAGGPTPAPGMVLKSFVIFLSIPLGIYWWLTEGPGALFDALRRRVWQRRSAAVRGEP